MSSFYFSMVFAVACIDYEYSAAPEGVSCAVAKSVILINSLFLS